jgi:ABC-type siderophore export system fused ATPase/permease subunit
MTLLSLVLLLVIIGVVLWAVQQIPMDAAIRRVIRVVVIVVVVLWLATSLLGGHHAEWNPRLW